MVERIRTLLESRQLTPTQFADIIGVARPIVSHILSGRNKPSLEVVQRILAAMPDLAMPWLLNGAGPMLAGTGPVIISSVPSEAAAVPAMPTAAAAQARGEVEEHRPTAVAAAVEAPKLPARDIERIEQERIGAIVPEVAPLRANVPASGRGRVMPKRFVAHAAVLDAVPQLQDGANAPSTPLAVTTERPPAVTPVQGTSPAPPTLAPVVEVADKAVPLQSAPADETPGAALASALSAEGDKPIRRIVIFYRDGSFADYQPE